jgi:hypothetical protein
MNGYEDSVMARRQKMEIPDLAGLQIDVATAEDIVLFKLEWFRLGNESSDRQWNDILGVLRARHAKLDQTYLDHWANELKVADLLAKSRQEAMSKI